MSIGDDLNRFTIVGDERQRLEKRLAELEDNIAGYPHWGAVLTAWDEERRGIMSALRNLPPKSVPAP
jgi:hypothetical protein